MHFMGHSTYSNIVGREASLRLWKWGTVCMSLMGISYCSGRESKQWQMSALEFMPCMAIMLLHACHDDMLRVNKNSGSLNDFPTFGYHCPFFGIVPANILFLRYVDLVS